MKVVGTSVNAAGHLCLAIELDGVALDGNARIADARRRSAGRLAATEEGRRYLALRAQMAEAKSKSIAATAKLDQLKRERREAETVAGPNLGATLVRLDEEISRVEREGPREVELIEPLLGLAKSQMDDKAESIAQELAREFNQSLADESNEAMGRLTELLEDNADVQVLGELAATTVSVVSIGGGGLPSHLTRNAISQLAANGSEAPAGGEPAAAGRRRGAR